MALVLPLSLSAFSFFFSTASVPSGHHWRFGVRSSIPLQRCSRARSSSLLCSALLPLLFPNQRCSNPLTHPPLGGAKRPVVQRRVATSTVLYFVLSVLLSFGVFFYWNPVLSHRILLRGLIPAREMGWLWVPLDRYFLCFWTIGALWGVCVFRDSTCGICMNKGVEGSLVARSSGTIEEEYCEQHLDC